MDSPESTQNVDIIAESCEIPDSETDESTLRKLSNIRVFSYSTGHFYNDLCACMWFTYLLLFLQKVVKLESKYAGALMLIGQATDALCTPLVGVCSDKNLLPKRFISAFGKRKSWHLLGTVCVTISFPLIFNYPYLAIWFEEWQNFHVEDWFKALNYVPFIVLFQFGWAAVQISHLALIPELSSQPNQRTTMNSLRFLFTVVANVTVFGIFSYYFSFGRHNDIDEKVSPNDMLNFRNTGLIIVAVGCYIATVFHFTTKEKVVLNGEGVYSESGRYLGRTNSDRRISPIDWLKKVQFYQIALLYMMSRLYINVSQVYFPFYIQLVQDLPKSFVAILPMVALLASFVTSSLLSISKVNSIDKKLIYFIGLTFGFSASFCMYFAKLTRFEIYGISVLIGISQAILLVTSLAFTADLISENTESGAFVYGSMSFVDKLANGLVYQIIELINPTCDPTKPHEACKIFYREVMVFVPGGAIVAAFLLLVTILPQKIGGDLTVSAETGETEENDRATLVD